MPKRKNPKPDQEPENSKQALQTTKKTDWIEGEPVDSDDEDRFVHGMWGGVRQRMNRFIRNYERFGGNVSLAAQATGITRGAYYRWTAGNMPAHRQFRHKLAKVRPKDVVLDAAEATVFGELHKNNLTAAMFTINKLGHLRGWQEQGRDNNKSQESVLETATQKAITAYRLWLAENPTADQDEKEEWLALFANRLGVPETEVRREMALQEYTEKAEK